MNETIVGLAQNLALLMALVFGYGFILQFAKQRSALLVDLSMGVLFGLAAALAMHISIPILDGVIIDTRLTVLALVGLFARWPAIVVAGLIACIVRWLIGGVGTLPGIGCIVCASLAGYVMSLRYSMRARNCSWLHFVILGFATVFVTVFVTVPWIYSLPDATNTWPAFYSILIPITIMYPISALLIGVLLRHAHSSVLLIDNLADSEKRFRRIFEGAPNAILIADMETGHIVDANELASLLLGRKREDIIGMHQSQLHPAENNEIHRQQFADHVQQLRDRGHTDPIHSAFLTADEKHIPVEVTASLYHHQDRAYIVGFFKDLRSDLATERALANAEILSKHLVHAAEAIIVALDKEGQILLFNPFAEQLTGYTTAELKDRNWFEILCPRIEYPAVWDEFERLKDGGMPKSFINPIKTKNGDERIVSWRNVVVGDNDVRYATISVGIDITEQRHMEEELRQSEKLQAIGQLAGGVAHDFNNQLHIISSFSNVLLEQLESEKLRDYVKTIMDTCRRSADLTAQLLAFSRKGAVKKSIINVQVLMQKMKDVLSHTIDKQIRISVGEIPEQLHILASESDLEHVIINLAVNARDAMPDGGELSFELEERTLNEEQAALKAGDYVLFHVRDNGIGMNAEQMKHIFEPFYSTKRQGKGTGLGLAAVYGTMRRHEGTVTVESEETIGTCFTLWLPRMHGDCQAEETSADSDIKVAQKHLLMVDDEELIVTVISDGLEARDVHVTAYTDAREALAFAREHITSCDLALVDLNMPVMNGTELIKELHALRPDLPIIVGTGFGPDSVDAYIQEHDRISILSKPYSLDDLMQRIQDACQA